MKSDYSGKEQKMNILSENNVSNGKVITKRRLDDLLNEDNAKIYEVIRVIKRKPIFLKEHYDRMKESIRLSNVRGNLNYDDFKKSMELLINENKFDNCNVRVSYYFNNKEITLFYFIESYYPSEEQFRTGVHTVTARVQRSNPNVKAFQKEYKARVKQIADENHAYEVILVNDDGTVSEGSRSNVFFVKNNTVITSPDSSVLLGVTRNKVIEICENNGITVEKKLVPTEELSSFDGAFITGTSNDVLPIRSINNIMFDSSENETVKKLGNLYKNEVNKELGK